MSPVRRPSTRCSWPWRTRDSRPEAIALKYTDAVFEDAAALGIRPADRYPKATEHIPEMLALTQTLIENGHAYVVDSGSVYFDVTSFPGYGKLSGNTLDNLREGHRDPGVRPAQAQRGGLRPVEGGRAGPAHEVGLALGRGLPRLARGVLGHVHEVPGRALRHPHGRDGSALPPSRGRDRAVRGRGRSSGRERLGARRASAAGGTEDREVDRQRGARARAGGARHGPRCRSAGSRSRRATAARWTSPGRPWRTRTAA